MITYRQGSKATRGGLDLVISLTPEQALALGIDAPDIGEAVDTLLAGLAALRTGPTDPPARRPSLKDGRTDPDFMEWLITDLTTLTTRIEGIHAAAVRAHADQGGSYGALATAMGVVRSTAQRRRDAVTATDPGEAETWATTPLAPLFTATDSTADDSTADDTAGPSVVNIAKGGYRPIQAHTIHGPIDTTH